ncbi:MAG TPA: hypothetical protein VFM55_01805 [Micromonosporaceae bacterium]|nr:hypothetical protein [Micromonosporaceae bacterium]
MPATATVAAAASASTAGRYRTVPTLVTTAVADLGEQLQQAGAHIRDRHQHRPRQ